MIGSLCGTAVEIDLASQDIDLADIEQLADTFQKKHDDLYTFTMPWVPIEIRNLHLIARIKGKKLNLTRLPSGSKDPARAIKRQRKCLFNGNYIDTPVYDSEKLNAGALITGPAVIEVPTTTAVIPPNYQCLVDEYNNYIITRSA